MVSFTLVIIIGYERSTPHSTALILPNSKMYILFELNHPTSCFDRHPKLPNKSESLILFFLSS